VTSEVARCLSLQTPVHHHTEHNSFCLSTVCVSAKQFKYPDCELRKPPVPRPNDRPVMGLRTTKNYVTQNAVENIQSIPPRPTKTMVDTRRGDKQSLVPSGLEPVYVHKKVRRPVICIILVFVITAICCVCGVPLLQAPQPGPALGMFEVFDRTGPPISGGRRF